MAAAGKASNAAANGKGYDEHWQQPTGTPMPKLKVWNSLTRSKVDFVPAKGKNITWYNCGPTVYDASHMGHARNYVTQDFLRRILRDYFGYDVHFVMNITDIDDKIIVRARHQNLFTAYVSETTSLSQDTIAYTQSAWDQYYTKFSLKLIPSPSESEASTSTNPAASAPSWEELQQKIRSDAAWLQAAKESDDKFVMRLDTLAAARRAIETAQSDLAGGRTGPAEARALLEGARDILSELLDNERGHTVTDPAIFRSLAEYWEKDYFDDMEKLRVEPPTTLTRVSEYVPEITAFVEKLVENGYAYKTEDDGSVYFDTRRFDGAKGKQAEGAESAEDWTHTYAKLQPWSKGNRELIDDGEGALASGKTKRSPSDFALWKGSKPGEPSWPSEWGPGRPGWHIECSVMASEVLGQQMDVHSGGSDLAFPHHDNELAQSEAYHDCRQWVNYFLHTGHLHIEGLKMSKSLKNFITIKEALAKTSARQLRLAFLLQTWHARMDFNEKDMSEVRSIEARFNNFFANVSALVRDMESRIAESSGSHMYHEDERRLMQSLVESQSAFHDALCDSFNTPSAVPVLINLVSTANVYVTSRARSALNVVVLQSIADWVTRMLRMFGLGEGAELDGRGKRVVGWGQAKTGASGESGGQDAEALLMPYLRTLSSFRDAVRKLAIDKSDPSEILALCDRLRDQDLVELGVALDDQEDGKALLKLVPAEQLRAARDEKIAAAKDKADKRAASLAAAEAKRREKLEKGRTPPGQLFQTPEYSKWDADGLPTHDAKGEEIAKSKQKKNRKDYDAQQKLHAAFLADTQGQ